MPSLHLENLIQRLKQGLSAVELVHVPHDRWPLPRQAADAHKRLRISVLDSSFNPPTRAHLALASVPASVISSEHTDVSDTADFDARLLLLSVRNADKALKPHDATYAQRLEMMVLLAKDVAPSQSHNPSASATASTEASPVADPNVAVAIIDEPTFVGKSRVLNTFLRTRLAALARGDSADTPGHASPPTPLPFSVSPPELTFVVGTDTLERILAARYYASEADMRAALRRFLSPAGDGARLVCARRVTPGAREADGERERRVDALVREYVEPGRVHMVDIGEAVESFSSSEVRQRVAHGDPLWTQMVTASIAEYIKREELYVPSDTNTN